MSDTGMRAKFEEWAVQHAAPLVQKREVVARSQDGRYKSFIVEETWQAWQAAQLAAPVSLPNCPQCRGTGQISHRGGYATCYMCGGSGVGDAAPQGEGK